MIWLALTWGWQVAFMVTGLMAVGVAVLWAFSFEIRRTIIASAMRSALTSWATGANDGASEAVHEGRPYPGQVLGHRHGPVLNRTGVADLQLLDPAVHGQRRGMDIKQFALFAWLPFLAADTGCILGGYLSPFFANRFKMSLINSRIAGIGIGAVCMIGPGLIGLVVSPIAAILLFSLGAFRSPDAVEPALRRCDRRVSEAGRRDGDRIWGMAGYLGGTLFSLLIGQLATTIGYEPLFVCLSVFDIIAFVVVGSYSAIVGAGC